MVKAGLGAKIFLAIATVVILVLGGALWLTKRDADRAAETSIDRALGATQTAIRDALAARSAALRRVTAGLAQVPTYVSRIDEAIRSGDRAALLDQVDEFREQLGVAWALITDDAGILQAWTLDRDLYNEDFSEGSLIGLALAGEQTEGAWVEETFEGEVLFQAVGVPIFDPSRTTVFGVLVAALPIDSVFAGDIKSYTDSDVAFFSLDPDGAAVVSLSTIERDAIATVLAAIDMEASVAPDAPTDRVDIHATGERMIGVIGPLNTAAGFPLGGYIGLRSWDRELAAYSRLQRTIAIAFAVGLALAVLASLILARQITRPVRRLVDLTRRVGEGQYTGAAEITTRDEIGELARAFATMLQELKAKDELVEFLSSSAGQTLRLDEQATLPDNVPAQPTSTSATQTFAAGQRIAGRYVIKEVIGVGGMGVVYRAHDMELDEPVAIKTLRSEAMQADANLIERFKQEIRLARRITHRNVVRTHDLGEFRGMYFITMEYVEGTTLKDIIRKSGSIPPRITVTIGKQLCRALEVAHEQGVIHRDVKPHNVVVESGGFIKVMDFGIARLAANPDRSLTAVGAAVGTPDYMAPEQMMGEQIDRRADIYAMGAVLFECVTGRLVFEAPSIPALMAKHLEEMPPDPRELNPSIPDSLAQVILKALAKQRTERWQSAAELHAALDRLDLRTMTA